MGHEIVGEKVLQKGGTIPIFTRGYTVVIEIPALDRLVGWLEAKQQMQIDNLTKQVQELITLPLNKSTSDLQAEINKENR